MSSTHLSGAIFLGTAFSASHLFAKCGHLRSGKFLDSTFNTVLSQSWGYSANAQEPRCKPGTLERLVQGKWKDIDFWEDFANLTITAKDPAKAANLQGTNASRLFWISVLDAG